mgnify:CR=1 FL=1
MSLARRPDVGISAGDLLRRGNAASGERRPANASELLTPDTSYS